jgi:DNA replication and repair protein RecF
MITSLRSLKIQGLRNISSAEFADFTRFNLFYGANGAGKTSLLESVHLLGLGRSFRNAKHQPLINYSADSAVVFGELSVGHAQDSKLSGRKVTLGVSRNRHDTGEIRIQGVRADSVAELAALMPLQVLNAETFQLLLGAPSLRRQFLDWGVFHVEQSFLIQWRRLQRALKQRNSLLRRGKISRLELAPWDIELVSLATAVTRLRQEYFELWLPVVRDMVGFLWPEGRELDFSLYIGWDKKLSMQDILEKQFSRDQELGYTSQGPHRADIKIRLRGMPVGEVLSRGQLKLLSAAMRLAQGAVLRSYSDKQCVFLVDDLPAELDQQRRSALCELLIGLQSQVFLTSIDPQSIASSGFDPKELSVFHVEQGAVYP